MNNNKYELTDECIDISGHKLYRIKALRSFGDVKAGDLGGFVEAEKNLSHINDAWVYDGAKVYDNACVSGDAEVYGNAKLFNNVKVADNALVSGNADYTTGTVCDLQVHP